MTFQIEVFGSAKGRGAQQHLALRLLGGGGDHAHDPSRQDMGISVALMECSFGAPSGPLSISRLVRFLACLHCLCWEPAVNFLHLLERSASATARPIFVCSTNPCNTRIRLTMSGRLSSGDEHQRFDFGSGGMFSRPRSRSPRATLHQP
jgi:hypothetical protein